MRKCSKIPYDDKKAALKDIKIIKADRHHFSNRSKNKKENGKLYAYDCPLCDKWHLTTKNPRKWF